MKRSPWAKALVDKLRSLQLWITTGCLALAPLFFGSVGAVWVALWAVALSIATILGAAFPLNVRQARILWVFLGLCLVYAVLAALQVTPNILGRLSDPVWQQAHDLVGLDVSFRISSSASIPELAIGHFVLLVTSFLSGFFAGTSRRSANSLIFWARITVLCYAIYGLAALALTPDMLLWTPKLAYRGSLTATFVNHNTAATYIGGGAILWCCWAHLTLRSLQWSSLRLLLLIPLNERLALRLVLRSAAFLTCFFALLLTNSRGGLICSCLGLLVAIGIVLADNFKHRIWYAIVVAVLALVIVSIWLSHIGRIGSAGLFDHGRWSVYGFAIEAIRQHPVLGAGAGTFENFLPSLRTQSISSWGIWDYAHSTILEIAVEMGLPMAAMTVIAAVASIFILVKRALRSEDQSRASLAAIAGIAVLGYSHSMIDFSLQIPGYLIVFGILLGCGLAKASGDETSQRRRHSRESNSLVSTLESVLEPGY